MSIVFKWTGAVMEPLPRFHNSLHRFEVGELYRLEATLERSLKSHRHYFAALREGWQNLPERYDLEPWAQSVDHLRAFALIKVGVFNSIIHSCGSAAEALRWAAIMSPLHPFSIVRAQRASVVVLTARSQSYAAMGPRDFQKSKVQVLDFIADLSGTTGADLMRAAKGQ